VLLRLIGGETDLIPGWLKFGGAQCLESYGVDPLVIATAAPAVALASIRQAIPPAHVEFLRGFADTCRFGDYLFVHAGIRPGIALDQQRQSDLRWIREPFLLDDSDHGFVVVHVHTITNGIDERPNRIGIDTGAYRTGALTAIYRITHDGWTAEQAFEEMKKYDFESGWFGGPQDQKKFVFEFYEKNKR